MFRHKKKYGIGLLLLLLGFLAKAQEPVDTTAFTLPTLQACPGDTILLPITVESFEDVRAFQFLVEWNAGQLSFLDTCQAFDANISTVNPASNRLWLFMFGLDADPDTPNSLPDGDTLIVLKFVVENLDSAASIFFNNLPPSFSSSVVVNSAIPGESAVAFSPSTNNGQVSLLDLALETDSSPITCRASGSLSGSSPVAGVQYHWFASGASYAASADTSASLGGLYTLVGQLGSCLDTQVVSLGYDTLAPAAPLVSDGSLTCNAPTATLAPDNLDAGLVYEWISPSGDTVLGPNLIADTAGLYALWATEPSNGCASQGTALMADETAPPPVATLGEGAIDCNRDSVYRFASYASSLNLALEWQAVGGGLLGVGDTLTVNQAGAFVLVATDLSTGCVAADSFTVEENRRVPTAEIIGDTVLNCRISSLVLQVDSLPLSAQAEWQDAGGNTLSNSPTLDWDQGGLIQLVLTDTMNGCSALIQRTVVVDTLPPSNGLSTSVDTLTCNQPQLILESLGASSDWVYDWSLDGIVVGTGSSLSLEVPGTYSLAAQDTTNGCENRLEAIIAQDTTAPVLSILGDDLLSCAVGSLTLSIQSSVPDVDCVWLGQGSGCELTVSAPGVYVAELTDLSNGCRSVDSIIVSQVDSLPAFAALASGSINCAQSSVALSSDTLLAQAAYVWLDAASDTLTVDYAATVSQAGVYTLIVTDSLTGCTAQQLVAVEADLETPVGTAAAGGTLDCTTSTVALEAIGLSAHTVFTWQDASGQALPDTVTAAPGSYYLVLQDTLNFCTSLDSVEVQSDYELPGLAVDFVGGSVLSCLSSELSLQASSTSSTVSYLWQGSGGDTLSTQSSLSVSDAGFLSLQVTNLSNGCAQDTLIEVTEDLELPVFTLSDTVGLLSCTEERLPFTATSAPGTVDFIWQGPNGGVVSTADSLEATQPGTYALIAAGTGNGCQDTVQIEVGQDISIPQASILGDSVLNCYSSTLSLVADSAGQGLSFAWQDAAGTLLSSSAVLSIGEPGAYTLQATDTLSGCVGLSTVVVESDVAPPSLSLVSDSEVLDCREASLALSVTGNSASLALAWTSDGQPLGQSDTLLVTTGGNYALLALDTLNGCDTLLSISIAQDTAAPVLDVVGDSLLSCAVGSLTLTMQSSAPNVDCVWLGLGSGCELTVSAPGVYIAELTDLSNGCRSLDSIAVSQVDSLPAFTASASGSINCRLDTVVLQVDTQLVDAIYTWLDENMEVLATSQTFVVSQAGTYVLEVMDSVSGCSAQQLVLVEEDLDAPVGQAAAGGVLDCRTVAVDLTAMGVADGVVLDWQNANGQILPTALAEQAGTYYLLLTDTLNGCSRLDSVEVFLDDEQPSLSLNSEDGIVLTCAQQVVSLSASSAEAAAFIWQAASGDTLSQSANFDVVLPGTYQVTAVLQRNGCIRDTSIEVMEDKVLPDAEIQIVQDFDCALLEAVLATVANDRYVYRWTGPDVDAASANAAAVTVFELGTYVLEVTDTTNGCTSSGSIVLVGDPDGIESLSFEVRPISCNQADDGGLIITGGTGGAPPYFYSLNGMPIGASNQVEGLSAGVYTLYVQDVRGCDFDTTFSIAEATGHQLSVQPDWVQLSLGDSVTLNTLFDVDPSQIRQIEWFANGQLIEGAGAALGVSPAVTTRYEVISTDENGCTSQAWVDVRVDRRGLYYVPNAFSPNGDGRNDIFTIYAKPAVMLTVQRLQIYDRWGSRVFEQSEEGQGWDGTYRGQLAPSGLYVFHAEAKLADGAVEIISGELLLLR